eukprot:378801-Amorphochlora_amoeboformis.AAC.1
MSIYIHGYRGLMLIKYHSSAVELEKDTVRETPHRRGPLAPSLTLYTNFVRLLRPECERKR